jgi:hypothetical protein
MTDLSPQAQAVLDAFDITSDGHYDQGVWVPHIHEQIAAALGAAVDRVISPVLPPCEDFDEYAHGFLAAHVKYRAELLAIAAELRGNTEDNQ